MELTERAGRPGSDGRGKKRFVLYIIFGLFAAACIASEPIAVISQYQAYTHETTAVVRNVDSRRIRRNRKWRTQYQVTYAYFIDDREYTIISDWSASSGVARDGREILIKFDPDDQGHPISEIDMSHAVSVLVSGAFTIVIIGAAASILARRGSPKTGG